MLYISTVHGNRGAAFIADAHHIISLYSYVCGMCVRVCVHKVTSQSYIYVST